MLAYLAKAPFLAKEREKELISFCQDNSLNFNELRLLNLAFIHTSYANESREPIDNNERLEFLGDSVLGMVTAEYLFLNYPELHEGNFSKIKAVVVSEESLSEVAVGLSFEKYLLLGRGELSQGRKKKAILADCVEAVIASIYLDQGMESAKKFILSFIPNQIVKVLENKISYKDYKTELQEYYLKRRGKTPIYTLIGAEGPDHDQVFSYKVELGTKSFGPATGKTKKAAEQAAAKMAVMALGLEKEQPL